MCQVCAQHFTLILIAALWGWVLYSIFFSRTSLEIISLRSHSQDMWSRDFTSWGMRCWTQISRAALASLSLSGFQRPNRAIHSLIRYVPSLTQWERVLTWLHPPGPQPNGFYHPCCLWNYSNKPITSSYRSQVSPHPLVFIKPASHSPFRFILLPRTSVRFTCPVLGVMYSATLYYLEPKISPSPTMWIGNSQNRQVTGIPTYLLHVPSLKLARKKEGLLNREALW